MDSWNYPAEVRMQEVLTARTVYVNRNFNRENTKVLVNPNFKHSVHINPNFSANVYVNPSVLQSQLKSTPPVLEAKPPLPKVELQPPAPMVKIKPPLPVVNTAPVQVSRFSKINTFSAQCVVASTKKMDSDKINRFHVGNKSTSTHKSDIYKINKFQNENKIISTHKSDIYKINKFQNENKIVSTQKSDAYKINNLHTDNRIVKTFTNKSDPFKINKLYTENSMSTNSTAKTKPVIQNNFTSQLIKVNTITATNSKYVSVNYAPQQLTEKSSAMIDFKLNGNRMVHTNLQKTNLPKAEIDFQEKNTYGNKLKRDFSTKNLKLVKSDSVNKFNPNRKSTPNKINVNSKYKLILNRRQISVNSTSKYKLIHNRKQVLNNKSPINRKQLLNNKNSITSKYKLVRVNPDKRLPVTNKFKLDNRVDKSKLLRLNAKAYLMNVDPQREIIKRKYCRKSEVRRVVRINGLVYRFSENRDVLRKITRSTKFDASKVKKKIVINGVMYVQKDSLTYVRKYANNLVKINSKVLKKDNNPCLVFRRTGKCVLHSKGKCIKQHNPKQISICIRFLQGACLDKGCQLSHDVSSEKMPTCKYFLEGCCTNDDCQYLHVKLGKNAEICKDFLEGYCMDGIQCMKKHQFLCPSFEKTGTCGKRSCRYPHGEAVRQCTDKLLNKIARSTTNFKVSKKRCVPVVKKIAEIAVPDPSVRYYEEETAGCKDAEDNEGYVRKPRVGELPSFIGFDD